MTAPTNPKGLDRACVVPMNSAPAHPALFCPHVIEGSGLAYRQFADVLAGRRKVYCFQAKYRLLDGHVPESIEQMASYYVEQMMLVQPLGPYHLFGYSAGGFIALEMARLVLAKGETVGLLAMGDTHMPVCAYDTDIWSIFAAMFCSETASGFVIAHCNERHLFWNLDDQQKIAYLAREELLPAGVELSARVEQLRKNYELYRRYVRVFQKYDAEPYDGTMTFFKIQGTYCDRNLELRSLARGGAETIELNASYHSQIARLPGVRHVADAVDERMSRRARS